MQPEESSPSAWPAPGSGTYGLLGRTLTHLQRSTNCTESQSAYQPSQGASPNFLRTPFWIASVLPNNEDLNPRGGVGCKGLGDGCSLRRNCSGECHQIAVAPVAPRLRRSASERPQPD